jgi:ArsR family transcriptional regulator
MDKAATIAALSALAQDNRIDVFRLLITGGPSGMAAGAIAEKLGLPAPTLSFHLAQLKYAGLVTCRRESRSLIYAAAYPAMNGLITYLTENCCGGHPEACGIAPCEPGTSAGARSKGESAHEAPARVRRR